MGAVPPEPVFIHQLTEQYVPFVRVEGGLYAWKRKTEFDKCQGNRGLDSGDNRVGTHQPRDRGDFSDESAQERVNHFDRRQIDQDAVGAGAFERAGEIRLELQGVPVVKIFLNRGDEDASEAYDRDAGH